MEGGGGMSKMKWIQFVFTAVILVCGGIACIVVGSLNVKQAKEMNAEVSAWKTARGTVKYAACDRASSGACVSALETSINGAVRQAVLVHYDHTANYNVGQVIDIAYNEDKPAFVYLPSQIPKPPSTSFTTIAWVLIAVGILLLLCDVAVGVYAYRLFRSGRLIKKTADAMANVAEQHA
jgi:flagellar basal body-associated protein FliL